MAARLWFKATRLRVTAAMTGLPRHRCVLACSVVSPLPLYVIEEVVP